MNFAVILERGPKEYLLPKFKYVLYLYKDIYLNYAFGS